MKNSLNLCIATLILVILGCSCPQKLKELANDAKSPSPTPTSTPTVNQTPTVKKGEYDLTIEKFNQISKGTPRADVERILGGKGKEISNTTGGGVRFTVNKWEGENFKAVILSFRDDKVMTLSQVGLK